MKKTAVLLTLLVMLMGIGIASAEKARGIGTDDASAYHTQHLQQHLYATDLHGTGNYLKVRMDAMPSNVLGHLEQADRFVLLALENGYALVEVLVSDATSPDSWAGLAGWVDADYLDCPCNDAQYAGLEPVAQSTMAGAAAMPPEAVGVYEFSSGAGAWRTTLTLLPDGTFFGVYGDSDMGDVGPGYPNGIHYFCSFDGRFAALQPLNGYTYAMTLDTLTPYAGVEHIKDGIRYLPAEPYGVEVGKDFLLYTPETPLSEVTADFLMWMNHPEPAQGETLGRYAIYNQEAGYAFLK